MCLTEGQTSDHIGAKILYPVLPDNAEATLIADKGYDSDEYRAALRAKGISACIPPRQGRTAPATYSKTHYKQRHKIENMFGRLKDWRRIATRYDRRSDIFMAAITLAAIVIWWLQ
jgi:transposase